MPGRLRLIRRTAVAIANANFYLQDINKPNLIL